MFTVSLFFIPLLATMLLPAESSSGPDEAAFEFTYEIYDPQVRKSDGTSLDSAGKNWWERSALDQNHNAIHDSLEDSTGLTANVLIDYARTPAEQDIANLATLGLTPAQIEPTLNLVAVNDAPLETIQKIPMLPNVVMVERRGTPLLFSDVATPAAKARESDEYSPYTAWELGYSGKGVNVAIMDTGIDNQHPSLVGKWLGGADFSKPDTFLTPRDGTHDADDTNGHGTTCAGIATGTGAPEGKYMGTAPDAALVDIRIGTTIGYAPGELFQDWYDAALEAVPWAIEHKDDSWQGAGEENRGIDILSLSWGVDVGAPSDGSDAYSRALDAAVDAGIITIVAAGNDGPNNDGFHGMGSSSRVISIGSTDDFDTIPRDDDEIAEYSSRGPRTDNNDGYPYDELKPDVSAPGTHIMQAQYDMFGDGTGNGYGNRGSGTSYATPCVVGVVALMLEANPDLTQEVIKEILRLTSERRGPASIPELDPFWNKDYGWGIIDAYKAVKSAEELEDVSAIDVELQCHVTNITDGRFDEKAATAEIQGVAWSRVGEIKSLEIRYAKPPAPNEDGFYPLCIDDKWRKVQDFEGVGQGEFINWTFSLDMRELYRGNNSLQARVTGADGSQSLAFSTHFVVGNPPAEEGAGLSAGIIAPVLLVVLVVIALAILVYIKKKRGL